MINYSIITKTLEKIIRTLKNIYVIFWNIKTNTKYIKVWANCINEIQTRFTNLHISRFFINNYCIAKRTLKINLELKNKNLNNNDYLKNQLEP